MTKLKHASLWDLYRARRNAQRWSSRATVAALTAEIERRVAAQNAENSI